MRSSGVFVDANLLVLLVAGNHDRGLIGRHRRLRTFSVEQYDSLRQLVDRFGKVLVTPNTLTEASNLLRLHGEPERSRLCEELRDAIDESEEVVVVSAVAARNEHFVRLGLTDAALLELVKPETPLLTVDLDLYLAASAASPEAAFNFNHGLG